MFSNIHKFVSVIIMLILFLLGSCATQQLTYSNFSKIKKGMTEEEVIRILGEPTKVTGGSVDAGGIGGIGTIFGLDNLSGTTMTWTTGDVKANVIFFKGTVKTKSFAN